jgi:hypothetical protein
VSAGKRAIHGVIDSLDNSHHVVRTPLLSTSLIALEHIC